MNLFLSSFQEMITSLVSVLVLITVASCNVSENKTYTTKYDNVDIQEVIKNERLLKNYVDCLLEKGHCTPDGLELRSEFYTIKRETKTDILNL